MAVGVENSDFEVKAKYGLACHAVAYTGCEESINHLSVMTVFQ